MSNHCNSYGFSGGFAAICSAISWYLVQNKGCTINFANMFSDKIDADHLQLFHYIALIVGVVIFVLSFFDFAGILYDITILFVGATLAIFASGGMMLYATYVAFHMACKGSFSNIADSISGARNVIEAQDQVGITIMVLDLIAALLLISAAISFSRTY